MINYILGVVFIPTSHHGHYAPMPDSIKKALWVFWGVLNIIWIISLLLFHRKQKKLNDRGFIKNNLMQRNGFWCVFGDGLFILIWFVIISVAFIHYVSLLF